MKPSEVRTLRKGLRQTMTNRPYAQKEIKAEMKILAGVIGWPRTHNFIEKYHIDAT